MVKTFVYAKADGTVAKRTVFVMAEDSNYIRGLDFAHLSEDEQKKAEKDLQDMLDKYTKKADEAYAAKEKELMAI